MVVHEFLFTEVILFMGCSPCLDRQWLFLDICFLFFLFSKERMPFSLSLYPPHTHTSHYMPSSNNSTGNYIKSWELVADIYYETYPFP